METVGSRVRTEIIRSLLREGPLTRAEIESAVLGAPAGDNSIVSKHLRSMEDAGIVECDVARGQRRGRTPRWTTSPAKVREVARTWADYLLNEVGEPSSVDRPDQAD